MWWPSEPSSGKSVAPESSHMKVITAINLDYKCAASYLPLSLSHPMPGFSAQYLSFIFSVLGSSRLCSITVKFLHLLWCLGPNSHFCYIMQQIFLARALYINRSHRIKEIVFEVFL